jgi:hypothetical protein
MNQAERKFALSIVVQGGHGPFGGLDAPLSATVRLKEGWRLCQRLKESAVSGCHHNQTENTPSRVACCDERIRVYNLF